MANLTVESPQYERDLRHSAKERKRVKDHSTKWRHGSRFLSGVTTVPWFEDVPVKYSNEGHIAKMRPEKRYIDRYHETRKLTVGQNIVKGRPHWNTPISAINNRHAKEISAADLNDVANNLPSVVPPQEDFLYSFDRNDSPDRPVTLEVFVKSATNKETERLVAKEYEVVDGNGEAVKGRRARRVLRSGTSERREEDEPVVVEGGGVICLSVMSGRDIVGWS
ncbi:hypothetical protein QBC40DRAFT_293188 [Triangularia verruculosa]|uniref:Uncharacterized protein n=1 Tax=Triangularia verruculosa TaxID=2587418 RepID=A0AAN6XR34_9PEZI|nr:hypothetical protein QBC40DRAFT_293188 [Triangularia verruculosa]